MNETSQTGALLQAHDPYARPSQEVLADLESNPQGLSVGAAQKRLAAYGPNLLAAPLRRNPVLRFLSHFNDVLIYVLLAAAVLKSIFGDWIDAAVILAVAVINAVIGFLQEGRAEKALDGIRRMLSLHAHVRRDGVWVYVEAEGLVPGDIVRVKSGDKVPADARLIEATTLRVEESALTGESVPTTKKTSPVPPDSGIGDRHSMLYSGTIVTTGRGIGVVTASGVDTEMGRIQSMLTGVQNLATPLTRQLDSFGKKITLLILGVAAIMLVIGRLLHNQEANDLLSAAIGFAVAAIPEGLPALVTITLALGVQQMAKRRAIVRKLTAVETLGSVTTVCSDKTGTLTRNEMTVRSAVTRAAHYQVTGIGYEPVGVISIDDEPAALDTRPDLSELVTVMALCNDARITEEDGRWRVVGEPTEGALRTLALKTNFEAAGWKRIAVIPFESDNKFMATLDEDPTGKVRILLKGAPGEVFKRSSRQLSASGSPEPIDTAFWNKYVEELSAQGLRVLAAASVTAADGMVDLNIDDIDDGMLFLGLVGIVDPPRPEAIKAIATMQSAGIRVKMITGDHAGTARAISREMGITSDLNARVITGAELEAMSQDQLIRIVREVDVFARTSPEHKLRIVKALQAHKEVVAMTGDGVNDAPALTRSDVGVAMGIKGTEATKEAADIVLADDNFATIGRAIEEGRRIRDNLQKSIVFLLPTTAAQSLVILVAVLFGFTLPLQPAQILWVNLITAVTLSLALAYEPAEADIMLRQPRKPGASLIGRAYVGRILWVALLISGATVAVFFLELAAGSTLAQAQTTAVTMLTLSQVAFLFNSRFLQASSLKFAVLLGNPAIWISTGALLMLQLAFVYTPFMNLWFRSAPIGVREWGYTLGLSAAIFLFVEMGKAIERVVARRQK
ncbi:MAG: HAD-IC family P-type ATPase [Kineosporiaceae bacterium]|nr:HAD-IC family P-type ATPase [Aeromicrobium sp.]